MKNLKPIFVVSFMMCICPMYYAFGAIGQVDTRKYVDWNSEPYSNYVRIVTSSGVGTGEFIDYKHILTNKHVANCCGINAENQCEIFTSDDKKIWGRVVATGGGLSDCKFDNAKHKHSGLDWAIIEIMDTEFVRQRKMNNKNGFEIYTYSTEMNKLKRGGFGALRVLSNQDIQTIKTTYQTWVKTEFPVDIISKQTSVARNGVDLAHGNSIVDMKTVRYKNFLSKYQEVTGKNFVSEYLSDVKRFKVIENCNISSRYQNQIHHTCTSWAGDSGSALIDVSNKIVGLHNSGFTIVGSANPLYSLGLPIDYIAKVIKELKIQNKQRVQERYIDGACLESDLPSHAASGVYINSSVKKLECNDGIMCSCAAQQCKAGYYLVINANNISQGWCFTRKCPDGQHLNVIDDIKTDTKCVDN